MLHLGRWAAGENVHPDFIDGESMARGAKLARWFAHEADRVYARIAETEEDGERRELVELIQRKGGDISGRELVQASRGFKKVRDAEVAMADLVESGIGSWVMPEQRGRGHPKARRFVLAPVYSVNVYDNGTGATESGHTVSVDGCQPESSSLRMPPPALLCHHP